MERQKDRNQQQDVIWSGSGGAGCPVVLSRVRTGGLVLINVRTAGCRDEKFSSAFRSTSEAEMGRF